MADVADSKSDTVPYINQFFYNFGPRISNSEILIQKYQKQVFNAHYIIYMYIVS